MERPRYLTVAGQYVLIDIGVRMLTPRELFRAQGFPEDYVYDRDADGKPIPKAAQIAACGNSVPPPVVAALVRANVQASDVLRADVPSLNASACRTQQTQSLIDNTVPPPSDKNTESNGD